MVTKVQSRSLALAAVALAVGLASDPALATSQTGTAKAAIVQAITLTENTNLNFGFIVPPAGAANVVLSPANAISGAGFTFLGGNTAGNWTAQGTTGQPAVVTFGGAVSLTGPATSTPMVLDLFTTDAAATFAAGNTLTFNVGATLHVNAAQLAGPYSGTYTVTVNY
jgi:Mat/Ecp fimbriae major subunit